MVAPVKVPPIFHLGFNISYVYLYSQLFCFICLNEFEISASWVFARCELLMLLQLNLCLIFNSQQTWVDGETVYRSVSACEIDVLPGAATAVVSSCNIVSGRLKFLEKQPRRFFFFFFFLAIMTVNFDTFRLTSMQRAILHVQERT